MNPSLSATMDENVHGANLVVYEAFTMVLQAISILFNGAIICTLWKRSLFKCPSNKFVFSLCLSQFLVSIISFMISITLSFLPTLILPSPSSQSSNLMMDAGGANVKEINVLTAPVILDIDNVTESSRTLNQILLCISLTVSIGTSITVGLISIERYITIARPMKYKSTVTPGRVTTVILVTWILSGILMICPLVLFRNEITLFGSKIPVPVRSLGFYYATIITTVTAIILSIMIVCYMRIFKIAQEKCQKVQIGHFTSPVSSISSDWPSSVNYSSNHIFTQGQPGARFPEPSINLAKLEPSRRTSFFQPFNRWCRSSFSISNNSDSRPISPKNSSPLLEFVLKSNLGKNTQITSNPHIPGMLDRLNPNSELNKAKLQNFENLSNSISKKKLRSRNLRNESMKKYKAKYPNNAPLNVLCPPVLKRKKWKTFLHQNYNSPRKTVTTILLLIGSVLITQVPLSVSLYTSLSSPYLYYVSFRILLSISSISSPILYGFLNRTIRIYLWKFLRRNKQYSQAGLQYLAASRTFDSRKASISSGDSQFYPSRNKIFCSTNKLKAVDNPVVTKPINIPSVQPQPKAPYPALIRRISEEIKIQLPVINPESNAKLNVEQPKETELNASDRDPTPNGFGEEPNVPQNEDETDLSSSFPRKPSQDSGADVTFSDDEENGLDEEEVMMPMKERVANIDDLNFIDEDAGYDDEPPSMRIRLSPMLIKRFEESTKVILSVNNLNEDEPSFVPENCTSSDESDEDFSDFDDDDYMRMKDLVRKKFSLTIEDDIENLEISSNTTVDMNSDCELELFDSVEV